VLTVIATFHPLDGRRDELIEVMNDHVPAVLGEDGCLQYQPHTVGKTGVVVLEQWESTDALRAHGEGAPLAGLRTAIEHLVSAPVDVVIARPVTTAPTTAGGPA
jgi:quinol monooxygenase YgiN